MKICMFVWLNTKREDPSQIDSFDIILIGPGTAGACVINPSSAQQGLHAEPFVKLTKFSIPSTLPRICSRLCRTSGAGSAGVLCN